jgi:1,4-alpha-glucan branching enzyme
MAKSPYRMIGYRTCLRKRMETIADKHQTIPQDKLLHRALNHLQEKSLLQSSDWPFLITTWQAKDYATDRFREHVKRFEKSHQ